MARNALKLSQESMCLNSGSVEKLRHLPVYIGTVTDSITGEWHPSKFAKVEVNGREWYADRVTGQLYDPVTLRCASSTIMRLTAVPKMKSVPKVDALTAALNGGMAA